MDVRNSASASEKLQSHKIKKNKKKKKKEPRVEEDINDGFTIMSFKNQRRISKFVNNFESTRKYR